jgi:hypothetical protein
LKRAQLATLVQKFWMANFSLLPMWWDSMLPKTIGFSMVEPSMKALPATPLLSSWSRRSARPGAVVARVLLTVPGGEVIEHGVTGHAGVELVEGAGDLDALGRHAGLVLVLDAGAGVLDALLDGAGLVGVVELVPESTS